MSEAVRKTIEERVFFEGDGRLEGMLGAPLAGEPVRGGVVVAHPYPPHGATMDLPVVYRIAQYCRDRGFATLRFNFRSVGGSVGEFSGTQEHRDVVAAVGFMEEHLATVSSEGDSEQRSKDGAGLPLGLAGYSFGGIMSARAVGELPEIEALALVGFGVGWEGLPDDTLERLSRYRGRLLAVCPENDEFGSPKEVRKALEALKLEHAIEVVAGADHFLQGRDREVGELVADFFAGELTRA